MSLVLALTKGSLSSDGTTLTITDDTGSYDASENPGGYGSPNEARADLALFLKAYNKRYDGEDEIQDTELSISTYDPEDVSEWTLTMNEDGWIQATVYGLKLYDIATSFQISELTYDAATNQIRKISTKTGVGPYTYTYEVVTEAALADDESVILFETIYNTYAIPGLCTCHYKANKYYFTNGQQEEDFNRYQEIDALLTSIKYDFGFGSYADGQKNVEQAEEICTCFTEDCGC